MSGRGGYVDRLGGYAMVEYEVDELGRRFDVSRSYQLRRVRRGVEMANGV